MRAKEPRPDRSNPANARKPAKTAKSGKSASPGRVAQLEAMVSKLRASLVAEARAAQARPARPGRGQAGPRRRGQADDGVARAGVKARGANQARGTGKPHAGAGAPRRRWPRSKSCAPNCTTRAKRCAAPRPSWRSWHASRPRAHARSCTAEASALEPHHDPDIEGVHDDDPFADDPFSGEKPPI